MTSSTAMLIVPPRPELPSRPPLPATDTSPASGTATARPDLPPGWTLPSRGATPKPPMPRSAPSTPRSANRTPSGAFAALRAALRTPRVLLAVYVVVLTLIALWPVPVDSGAGPMLRLVSRVIPILTYARIEFGANILLFIPLGVLLALILQHRYLVVPIAFIATVTIESIQALMIDRRTPSLMDILANLAGACIGLVIVAYVEWRRSRREQPARVAPAQ